MTTIDTYKIITSLNTETGERRYLAPGHWSSSFECARKYPDKLVIPYDGMVKAGTLAKEGLWKCGRLV